MFIYICLYFLLFFVETDKHKWNRPELRGQQTEQPVTSLIRTSYEKLVNERVSFHVAKATSWDLLKMNPVDFLWTNISTWVFAICQNYLAREQGF